MNNHGKMNTMWVVALVAIAAIVIFPQAPFHDKLTGLWETKATTPATTGVSQGSTAADVTCKTTQQTMTLGSATKRYDIGTSVGTIYDRVYVKSGDGSASQLGLKTDGSTITVTPGNEIEIVYAANSTTYYPAVQKFKAPCDSTAIAASLTGGDAAKLVAVDTPTLTLFNFDDGLSNSNAQNDTVGLGATSRPRLRILFTSATGYSPYGDLALVALYNNSGWDGADFTASSTDVTLTDCAVPLIASNERSTTGYSLKAWCFKGIEGASSRVVDVFPSFKSDATNAATDIVFYLYDQSYFQNSKSGLTEFGWQSDLDADVGATTEPTVTYNVGA